MKARLDHGALQIRITSYNVCYTKLLRIRLEREEVGILRGILSALVKKVD